MIEFNQMIGDKEHEEGAQVTTDFTAARSSPYDVE